MLRLLYVDPTPALAEAPVVPRDGVSIGFAAGVEEALLQARQCDVLMVSAALPGNAALQIVRAVAEAEPGVRILVKDLAGSRQPATDYIEAGASGWLL